MRSRVTKVAAVESLVLAVSAGFYAAFILRSDFSWGGKRYFSLIDDSMISMVYARNLVDGHGLVWQPGDKVEGYTNLLWTLWMAVLHLLPFSEQNAGLPVMISGAAILVATMLVVRSICRTLAPDRALVPAVAMALVGLSYALVFWTLRGMETGLSALLVALGVRLALDFRAGVTTRRTLALAAVLAAAVLTRDDLVILAVVIIAFAVSWAGPGERRRVLAILGGVLAVTIAAHVAFRLAYYGDALPNTYYLKVEGIPLGTRLHRGVVALTYTSLTGLYVAIALVVAALACAWRTPRWPPLACLAAVVGAEFAYSVYVGGDYAEQLQFPNRFIVTALPLLMVLAAFGMSDLLRHAGNLRMRRAAIGIGIAILVAAAVLQGYGWSATKRLGIHGPLPYSTARVAIALATAALFAYLAFNARRRSMWLSAAVAGALLVLTFAAFDYGPIRHWVKTGADERALERFDVARAVLLRENSGPSTSAAVIVAGNWAYFSHRKGIDLLGKADAVIAHRPQHTEIPFKPGHTKWDYAYSVGKLRPDVVVDLVFPTERDLCDMGKWGYRQIAARFFVRKGARGIDVKRLAIELPKIDSRAPFEIPSGCA